MPQESAAAAAVRGAGADAPSVPVTFLFTDIEGSTSLLRDAGTSYGELLEDHRRLLRNAFAAHGGQEVDTQGDSFFVAFGSPREAVGAAVDAERALAVHPWPAGLVVRVRMGLHTGQATAVGRAYVGLAVHRGARIAAVASGGQVLVSESTAALVADELPAGVELRALGAHRLKDFPRPTALFQLDVPGLPTEFPPLRTPSRRPSLPAAPGSLLGREDDLATLVALLRRTTTRLVTVTGTGGIGKTRLALEAARAVAPDFPGGAVLVPLSALTDPRLVLDAVAVALGARREAGVVLLDAVRIAVGDERTLLVLDNVEQVAAAAGDLAALVERTPSAVVLVTSRQVLRLRSEQQYPLAPLAEAAAVRLFAERAAAVRPGFTVRGDDAATVAEICRRLDGLPLAIELAAARLRLLPPETLLDRLRRQLDVLGSGPVDLPERQRTLRATMDWSHGLLGADAQALFARLGVFAGDWPLSAAEAVCARPGEPAVLDTLADLLDASLLVAGDGSGAEPRFTMLETVRAYAAEKLAASADRAETERRHTRRLLDVSEQVLTAGSDEWRPAMERFDAELPDFRTAMRRVIAAGDVSTAALLLRNSFPYHSRRDGEREFVAWLDQVLPLSGAAPPDVRGRLLVLRAISSGILGDLRAVRPLLDEGRRLLPDDDAHAYDVAVAVAAGVYAAMAEGDVDEASRCVEEALGRFEALQRPLGQAFMQLAGGDMALVVGDVGTAERRYSAAVELAGRLRDEALVGEALSLRGLALLAGADVAGARRSVLDGAAANRRAGQLTGMAYSLEGLAAVALADGRPAVAARALAAAAAARRHVATPLAPALPPLVDGLLAQARAALGDDAYRTALADGGQWSAQGALERTLADLDDGRGPGRPA